LNARSLDELLADARTGLSPSDAQVEALGARLAAPPLTVSATAEGRWAAFQATGSAGLAAAGLLVAGGFIAGLLAHRAPASSELPPPPPRAAVVSLAPELTVLEPSAEAPAATPPVSGRVGGGQAGAARPRAAHSSLNDSAAELALLERIDRALRNSDPALARALLGELEASQPRTHFSEERSAARIMADCLAGERSARESAGHFLETHPASVYASRLRALCQLD
jgi:hypothetical protein